jgi:tripartite-type tricarboxylate transporter receptor subunit TctC
MKYALSFALSLALASAAAAQEFPTRPITIIVPFAAGGSTDMVARLTAEGMSKALGQSVVVENIAGSGGTIASARLATSPADGYRLMVHHVGLASAATLYRKLPYDTKQSFQPLGVLTHTASTIIARPDFAPNNVAELVQYMKSQKDRVTLAHAGIGAASHLCGMLLQRALGVQVTTVPYRGNGPIMNDLIGKQLDMTCDQATSTTSQILANNVKAYAVTSKSRIPDLPNLPTMEEGGLKGVQLSVWHGIYAPKGTPQGVVDKLVASIQQTISDPTYIERMKAINTSVASKEEATPAGLSTLLNGEIDRWSAIIKAAGEYAD